MNRKNLTYELDYTFPISEKDTGFIHALYEEHRENGSSNFLYRMGRSGTKNGVAGEMQFHSREELDTFYKGATECINDFVSSVAAIKTLKEIN